MVSSNHRLEASYGKARQVLKLMEHHGLLATHQNFAVLMGYIDAHPAELKQAIDLIRSNGGVLRQEDCEDLFAQFLSPIDHSDAVDDIGGKLISELKDVIATIDNAGNETRAYSAALDGVSGELGRGFGEHGGGTAISLKRLVDHLIVATNHMSERAKKLEKRLADSSAEVVNLKRDLEIIRRESVTDTLTGLGNRKLFDEALRTAAEEATEKQQPLSLIIGDIDHFKKFNDTWGHQTGDQVLKLVAHCFKENVKGRDSACRYGGEEFGVVLPNTALKGGKALAEAIRYSVETKKVVKRSTGENLGTITMSFGIAELVAGEPISELVRRADACLYAAKQRGRNRVELETDVDVDAILGDKAKTRQTVAPAA